MEAIAAAVTKSAMKTAAAVKAAAKATAKSTAAVEAAATVKTAATTVMLGHGRRRRHDKDCHCNAKPFHLILQGAGPAQDGPGQLNPN
jgi:hypothetical protein